MALLGYSQFDSRAMGKTIEDIIVVPQMFRQMMFKDQPCRHSKYIDVDIETGGKKVLPFVTEREAATQITKTARSTASVKIPRIRVKLAYTAPELINHRASGLGPYNPASLKTRRNQVLARDLAETKRRYEITKEWMCSRAVTGTLTVVQENLEFTVDYQFTSSHLPVDKAASASLRWNGTGPRILDDIQTYADLIRDDSGMDPTGCLVGKTVATALRNDATVQTTIDNRRKTFGAMTWDVNDPYIGHIEGIPFYRYAGKYTDKTDTSAPLLADDYLVMFAGAARTTMEYGPVYDLDAANKMTKWFVKHNLEVDPSVLMLYYESCFLAVPWQPDGIVYAKVTQ